MQDPIMQTPGTGNERNVIMQDSHIHELSDGDKKCENSTSKSGMSHGRFSTGTAMVDGIIIFCSINLFQSAK
jgi:hypothetical protein